MFLDRLSVVLLWVVLSIGCATSRVPGTPVHAGDARIAFRGLSIMPPNGQNWYLTQRDPTGVLFAKVLMDDDNRPIGNATFGLVATTTYSKGDPVANLKTFAEEHQRGGGRITTLSTRVTPGMKLGAECVRTETIAEERDNPVSPGALLTLTIDGVYCRHPHSPHSLVHLSYSERRQKSAPSHVSAALRNEAEAVLQSVLFVAFPRAEVPADARVTPPEPTVPSERAKFSGRWSGTLDNGIDHALVAEQVYADDAMLLMSLGLLRGPTWEWRKASFQHGALVTVTPGGTSVAYRFQPDGSLRATITNRDGTAQAVMTRLAE
jgi:hypothetical protein